MIAALLVRYGGACFIPFGCLVVLFLSYTLRGYLFCSRNDRVFFRNPKSVDWEWFGRGPIELFWVVAFFVLCHEMA